jgi:chromosome partitioning protein
MRQKIICVGNQKGGVGKTTTAVHIAHGVVRLGYEILLVDLDAQGNVSDALGIETAGALSSWLLMNERIDNVVFGFDNGGRKGLEVVRSDKTTAQLKMILSGQNFKEMKLANALRKVNFYDAVILDCPPSIDVLHVSAIMAADWVIIPTKLDNFSTTGVREMLRSVGSLREESNCSAEIGGILPTFHDMVTNESQAQLKYLVENFGNLVWPPIPQDTKVREAARRGQTIFEYNEKSAAAIAYASIVDRVEVMLG